MSYNFGKRTSGEDLCELNNSTYIEHPSDLKTTSNFIYRGTEVGRFFFNSVPIPDFIFTVAQVVEEYGCLCIFSEFNSNISSFT